MIGFYLKRDFRITIAASYDLTHSDIMNPILQNHPFCRFVAQIEQQAGGALHALQSRHDLNRTMLLYCCWFAVCQQGLLSKTQIKRLIATLYAWHQRIVSPLDKLCNSLKLAELDNWIQSLSNDALQAKHTAERIEQLLIVDILPKKPRRGRPTLTQMVTHACLNVNAYYQSVYLHLDDKDYPHMGEIITAIFPDLEVHKATSLCRNILAERQSKEPVQKNLSLGLEAE